MKKRLLSLLLVAAMVTSIAGCGNSGGSKSDSKDKETQATDTKTADTKGDAEGEYVVKIAHNQATDQGYGIGVKKLQDLLADKDPRITVEVYDNGVLGNERDVLEGNQLGTVDIAITSIGVVSNFSSLVGVINLPFMFSTNEDVEAALENENLNKAIDKIQDDAQVVPLGVYSQGFRHVVSNKGPIESLDSFKGLKIRVPESDLYVATFNALGASPTPIAWGEMYTSMQTGVVDAFENTPVNVVQYKLEEVSKNEIATNHIWDGAIITANPTFWSGLPEDVQKTLKECINESAKYQRKEIADAASKCIETVKKAGVNYQEVSDDLHNQLVEAVQPVYDDYYKKNPDAKSIVEAIKTK